MYICVCIRAATGTQIEMEVLMNPGFQRISCHFMLRLSTSKRPAVQQPVAASLFNLVLLSSVLSSCTSTGVQAAAVTLSGADAPATATTTLNGTFSKLEIARAHRYLKTLSEATVRSIQSPDGDIIDCVLREKQPAFNHPLLKNHTIQEFPSSIPAGMLQDESASAAAGAYSSSLYGTQLWHRNGRCAKGTVPIRRPSISNLLDTNQQRSFRRLRSIARYNSSRPTARDIKHKLDGLQFRHEYAIAGYGIRARVPGALPVYGTYVVFNVWNPSVTVLFDMSIAQLWLTSGNYKGTNLDSVEVGWTVEPLAYGDTNTRLFIYWTNDAYTGNGCLDLRCPGFVHVSSDIALGGTFIGPLSTYKGSQHEVQPILVWKDPGTGNWWLRIGTTNIGYWPSSLFKNGLSQYADSLQWGGEIVNSWPDGQHTNTQMGSGHFSNEGFGGACYARSLSTLDSSNTLSSIPLSNVRTFSTNRDCYDIQSTSNDNWGSAIFFGGPGFNANCP